MTDYNSRKILHLSFVSALMVVMLHSWVVPKESFSKTFVVAETFLCQGVTRIAVPFFFVVSGFLLFLNCRFDLGWWREKLQKRVRSLLVPYLAWALVGVANSLLLQHVCTNAHNEFDFASVAWWLKALGVTTPPLGCYHLWFVRSLIVFVLLSLPLGWLVRRYGLYAVIGVVIASLSKGVPFLGDGSLAYFALGAYFATHPVKNVRHPTATAVIAGLVWLVGNIAVAATHSPLEPYRPGSFASFAVNAFGLVFLWLAYDACARVCRGGGGLLASRMARSSSTACIRSSCSMSDTLSPLFPWTRKPLGPSSL